MNVLELYIDPDIARASTLPSAIYADDELYRHMLEKIFVTSWQVIEVDVDPIESDNVVPFILLEGALNEPLVLVRKDTNWKCLSNVCTHRGNILITRPGHYANLVCGYHGKCFDLDGRFKSMPAFEGAIDFPSLKDDLPELELAQLGPLKFTSIASDVNFTEAMQPIIGRMSWFPFDELTYVPELSNTYEVDVHWALYCENYLEGFHIPFVHAQLNKALKFSEYKSEIFKYCNLQLGVAKDHEPHFDLAPDHPDFGKKVLAYYWWLFPNTMLNIYTWGLSLNIVKPKGIGKTEIVFKTYLLPGVEKDQAISTTLNNTEMEDEAIVKNVQTGVKSRFYTQGRFSPAMEQGVHHFQSLLVKYLQK
ncbi:MAG: Rieske 2Fe-2S domain-containing protein [Saprospiraceae bacterium]|nr:Rieske 2Fe-2S domain-containing protein [Saprospiraceae bacterium]